MNFIYLAILISLTATEDFTLFLHEDQAAKCLDGSPSGLYYHPGKQSDKFIIYFEGGGLCRGDGLEQTL